MQNDWMLDVLADLKRFAQLNGMPMLADKLSETATVAALEMTSVEEAARGRHGGELTAGAGLGGPGNIRRI